jgi:hypothetical protein
MTFVLFRPFIATTVVSIAPTSQPYARTSPRKRNVLIGDALIDAKILIRLGLYCGIGSPGTLPLWHQSELPPTSWCAEFFNFVPAVVA